MAVCLLFAFGSPRASAQVIVPDQPGELPISAGQVELPPPGGSGQKVIVPAPGQENVPIPAPQGAAHPHVPKEPVTLHNAIGIALANQPAVHAARASLGAAHAGHQALEKMRLVSLVRQDIPIRVNQACLGIRAAQGGLTQAEWQTTYAVTRNFFTVIYARKQGALVADVVAKLHTYRKTAKTQVDMGNPDFSQTDVDTLDVTIGLYTAKRIEADQGVYRALAALREAMGVPPHCQLDIVSGDLPPVVHGLDKKTLVHLALDRRGEMAQAGAGAEIVRLEICAQQAQRTLQAQTFASGADIHARPIPQGFSNGVYVPGAVGIEMPTMLVGHMRYRVQRARELSARADAVLNKTRGLVTLEAENAFHKWQDAAGRAGELGPLSAKAAKVVKSTSASYDLGKAKIDELLRAQGLEAQVEAEYNKAVYEQALAIAALERITAGGYVPVYRVGHVAAPHHAHLGPPAEAHAAPNQGVLVAPVEEAHQRPY